MANKVQRKVWVSQELKDALQQYWRHNPPLTGESEMARNVIEDIAEHGLNENALADYDSPGKIGLRVWIDADTWTTARNAIVASGLSVHSAVRRILIQDIGGLDGSR